MANPTHKAKTKIMTKAKVKDEAEAEMLKLKPEMRKMIVRHPCNLSND